jgi:hypothetical protein
MTVSTLIREREPATVDHLAARRSLRTQIARLERRLGAIEGSDPLSGGDSRGLIPSPPRLAPRLLGLGELERVRDGMLVRLRRAEEAAAEAAAAQAAARARLEAMRADPAAHRGERVALAELGLPGCGSWYVRPRRGLLAMLAGWWEVKLSSGCPLWATTTAAPRAGDPIRGWRRRSPCWCC